MKTTNNLNPHILLVIKWLRNPNSVTQEELDANADDAYAAYATHTTDDAYAATNAAERLLLLIVMFILLHFL